MPSIYRVNGPDYLLRTVSHLSERIGAVDKGRVTVVVFLADSDGTYNNATASLLSSRYPGDIASGFLQVLRVSSKYYPPLEGLKRNLGDAPERVRWRTKQVN